MVGVLGALALSAGPARAVTFAQFTSQNLGGDSAPCWSRDGGYVFYSTRVSGFPYIYKKAQNDPMTTTGTRITTWLNDEYSVTVSPDNNYVMIETADSLNSRHIYRCPSNGGPPLTQVTFGPHYDTSPCWWGSGATQLVAFATDRGGAGFQIWTLVPNGILPGLALTPVTGPGFQDLSPTFSPDGSRIAFASTRAGANAQIYVSTWDGSSWGAPVQLTSGGGAKSNPSWSPSGMHIAFASTTGGHGGGTSTWIMTPDGLNAQMVTGSGTYDAEAAWSPDGDHLAFVSDQSGAKYIWLASAMSTPAATASWGRIKDQYRQ